MASGEEGGMRKLALFIECPCGQLKQVKTRWHQARQKHCSRSCAQHFAGASREDRARGGRTRGARARLAIMQTIGEMTPLQAFRCGYDRGLHSKWRQTNKRLRERRVA
jgi:hypothetical protein